MYGIRRRFKNIYGIGLTGLALAMVFALTACGTTSTPKQDSIIETKPPSGDGDFELTILHINDHHSNLDSQSFELSLPYDPAQDNALVRLQLGGMSFIQSLLDEYRGDNALFLSSGEVNGTLFYSMFGRGDADFEVFNVLNPDAYMPGNHEFDEGDGNLARLIDMAEFTILSGNIVPTERSPLYGKLGSSPYIIKQVNGQDIAVIGVLKIEKTMRSSMVSEDVDFIDEFEFVESMVREVSDQGVNKVIILSHLGYEFDAELAANISGIDVIVGGDTHNLLDSTGEMRELQLPVSGEYPTIVKNPENKNVYIVQAWEYAKGFGVLNVKFDKDGEVIETSGKTILPVGGPYLVQNDDNQWEEAANETLTAIIAAIENSEILVEGKKSNTIDGIIDPMKAEIERSMTAKIGTVSQNLPFDRIPTPFEAGEEPNGSFVAQVVADAFLNYAPAADMAIQNAGGVRAPLMEGDLTMGDAMTILPFSNTIAIIRIPGSEVVAVLDEAIKYSQGISQSTGAFPYASHLRYDVYLNAPENVQSAYNLEVRDRVTGEWHPIDLDKEYTIVTNSFTVLGRDNYLAFERAISNDPDVMTDLNIAYAVPLIDYVQGLEAEGSAIVFDRENYCVKSAKEYTGQ